MMSLRKLAEGVEEIPTATSWYLTDLAEARGKQELFTRQSPQKLKALREHALIESAVSSNRMEGVLVEDARVGTIMFGQKLLRDRDEEEVRGYRDALQLIHERASRLPFTEATVRRLHRLARANVGDAGRYKERQNDIVERLARGGTWIRFRTVSPAETPAFMAELVQLASRAVRERWLHPLIVLAASNLDFLCIHPFRDGNGRVSRLLWLLQSYHLGYEVGRYISLERLVEQNKERYYETLYRSSQGWHQGKHDPWPYVNYVLFILRDAYKELERRVGETASPRGAKAELVLDAIRAQRGDFRLQDIERACASVSRDWIRRLLADLRRQGKATCTGKGPAARWRFMGGKGSTLK